MLRFSANPHPKVMDAYKSLVRGPLDALLLHSARLDLPSSSGKPGGLNPFRQAVREYMRLDGETDPNRIHEKQQSQEVEFWQQQAIRSLVGQPLEATLASGEHHRRIATEQEAEHFFLASLLLEKHPEICREYEMQKLTGEISLAARVIVTNLLQDEKIKHHAQRVAAEYTDYNKHHFMEAYDWMAHEQTLMLNRLDTILGERKIELPQRVRERFCLIALIDGCAQLKDAKHEIHDGYVRA